MLLVIVMMLTMTLIALTAMAPYEVTQIRRDREEELIHRGQAYKRAIKLFYKRFGRYPTSLEELENTANLRFIRQLYKDPLSPDGQWRIIHLGEAKYPPKGFGYSNIPGAQSIGTPIGGGPAGTPMLGGGAAGAGGAVLPGGMGAILGTSGGGFSAQLGSNIPSTGGMTPAGQMSSSLGGKQIGAPIIGVASTNTSDSIHEVNERKKYNEWEFFYDPRYDIAAQMMQVAPGVLPGLGQPGQLGGPGGLGRPGGSPGPGGQQGVKP